MDFERRKLALRRWRLLGKMLQKGKCNVNSGDASISVRRFSSFGLLQTSLLENNEHHLWYRYSSKQHQDFSVDIKILDGTIDIKDLLGFNNTGNVCVWPSEEILTYHILGEREVFRNKSVLELGGGMTCLAGVALAACTDASNVVLTDGNQTSVNNVYDIIARNQASFGNTQVSCRELIWDVDNIGDLSGQFDIIIMADCLFFDEYRESLIEVIYLLLKEKGEVISFAPSRTGTFKKFADAAEEKFVVETSERYDEFIWSLHLKNLEKGNEAYDSNIHYPMLMKMTLRN